MLGHKLNETKFMLYIKKLLDNLKYRSSILNRNNSKIKCGLLVTRVFYKLTSIKWFALNLFSDDDYFTFNMKFQH